MQKQPNEINGKITCILPKQLKKHLYIHKNMTLQLYQLLKFNNNDLYTKDNKKSLNNLRLKGNEIRKKII